MNLRFLRCSDLEVDAFALPIGDGQLLESMPQDPAPAMTDKNGELVIHGQNFTVRFNKAQGQIVEAIFKGTTVLVGGPHLNLAPLDLPAWSVTEIKHATVGREAVVTLSGKYGTTAASFILRIDGSGVITTDFHVPSPPANIRNECGVTFMAPEAVTRLCWDRKGIWSAYPPDHIGHKNHDP